MIYSVYARRRIRSHVPTSLSTMQSHMPNRSFVVSTATLATVTFHFQNSALSCVEISTLLCPVVRAQSVVDEVINQNLIKKSKYHVFLFKSLDRYCRAFDS